jgi:ribonuclease kappa
MTQFILQPAQAWFCTVVSAFGVVILSVLAGLFYNSHETMMGSITSPSDGKGVAKTIFGAIVLYIAFFLFCGCQIWVLKKQSKIQL